MTITSRSSDLAPACPRCGQPAGAEDAAARPFDLPAKICMAMILGGLVIAVGGASLVVLLRDAWAPWGTIIGALLCGYGLLVAASGAILRWFIDDYS